MLLFMLQKRKHKTFADGILVVKDGQECTLYSEVRSFSECRHDE